MATVYASTNDALVYKSLGGSPYRDGDHDSTTGTAVISNAASNGVAIAANCLAGGRGNLWLASRVLMDFDTKDISVAPSAATLKVYGITNGTADIIVLRSWQDLSSIATDWYNAMIDPSTAIPGNAWSDVNVTEYSNELTTWSTSGYNDIGLNATALADMASLDTFKLMIMEYDYDYRDVDPDLGGRSGCQDRKSGLYFADQYGTSKDPYIDYTPGVAAGYGNAVLGVASGNISTVNGVATANISKVSGV